MKFFIILLLAPSALSAGSELYPTGEETQGWCYRKGSCGPNTWGNAYANCKQVDQSPINIPADYWKLEIPKHYDLIYLDKNNHSVEYVTIDWKIGGFRASYHKPEKVYIKYGNYSYVLNSLHFHWGDKSAYGSEHTVGGRAYAGEIHLVYYNRATGNMYDCLRTESATDVLVLAVFVDTVPTYGETNVLYKLINTLKDIQPGVSLTAKHNNNDDGTLNFGEFFKDEIFDYAYAYTGSLTSPKCSPATWLVLRRPVMIYQDDFVRFTTEIPANEFTPNNFRPLQRKSATTEIRLVKIKYVSVEDMDL